MHFQILIIISLNIINITFVLALAFLHKYGECTHTKTVCISMKYDANTQNVSAYFHFKAAISCKLFRLN